MNCVRPAAYSHFMVSLQSPLGPYRDAAEVATDPPRKREPAWRRVAFLLAFALGPALHLAGLGVGIAVGVHHEWGPLMVIVGLWMLFTYVGCAFAVADNGGARWFRKQGVDRRRGRLLAAAWAPTFLGWVCAYDVAGGLLGCARRLVDWIREGDEEGDY